MFYKPFTGNLPGTTEIGLIDYDLVDSSIGRGQIH